MTCAVAAAIDYSVTPKRFTPGWELVLSKRSLVVTYGVLALGLASGTKLAQALADRHGEALSQRRTDV